MWETFDLVTESWAVLVGVFEWWLVRCGLIMFDAARAVVLTLYRRALQDWLSLQHVHSGTFDRVDLHC